MLSHSQGTPIRVWVGSVLEDKKRDSAVVKISVPELFPDSGGSADPADKRSIIRTQNASGQSEETVTNTTNHLTCTWLGESDFYAPWVRKGEQVLVYQIGDTPKFFWGEFKRDRELRKTDIKRIYVAAKNSNNEALDDSNIYFFELNSEDQTVSIQTSKANGEVTRYVMKLNCKTGEFVLTDDLNNSIYLNSQERLISLTNGDKASYTLSKQDAFISAPRDLMAKAGRQFVVDAPVMTIQTSAEGSGITKLSFKELALDGDAITLNSQMIGLNGQTTVGQPLLVNGDVFAQGFSVGSGSAYSAATTDISAGTGSSGGNSPNSPEDAQNLRHTTAHEDFLQFAQLVRDQLDAVGAPAPDSIMPPAVDALMPKNKGE